MPPDAAAAGEDAGEAGPDTCTPALGTYSLGRELGYFAIADFNGDGTKDLAISAESLGVAKGALKVLLNDGHGAFAPILASAADEFGWPVAADFDGDGRIDVAMTSYGTDTVGVLRNAGAGVFSAESAYSTGDGPCCPVAADFNGDGSSDLALANCSSDSLSVLLNEGAGSFAAKVDYGIGHGPRHMVVGDFNADAAPDLALAVEGNVTVLLNGGGGAFASRSDYPFPNPLWLDVGDFNEDGAVDIAVADSLTGAHVLLNAGSDAFVDSGTLDLDAKFPFTSSVATGDVNGDGKADLVVGGGRDSAPCCGSVAVMSILLGNGDGTFVSWGVQDFGAGAVEYFALEDFDGDGKSDIALMTNAKSDTLTFESSNCF